MFNLLIKSLILGIKCVFKHHNLNMLGLKKTNTSNLHPLEVVDRDSETQLQVDKHSNYIIQHFKG